MPQRAVPNSRRAGCNLRSLMEKGGKTTRLNLQKPILTFKVVSYLAATRNPMCCTNSWLSSASTWCPVMDSSGWFQKSESNRFLTDDSTADFSSKFALGMDSQSRSLETKASPIGFMYGIFSYLYLKKINPSWYVNNTAQIYLPYMDPIWVLKSHLPRIETKISWVTWVEHAEGMQWKPQKAGICSCLWGRGGSFPQNL